MSVFLGVDVGASVVKLGLHRAGVGPIGTRHDFASHADVGPQATMRVVTEALDGVLEAAGITRRELAAVGACCPAPVNADGMSVYPTNIAAGWKDANVRDMVERAVGLPAVLLNDGDAAAYREHDVRRTTGREGRCMVQFITGTGLGGSIIFEGRVWAGPLVAGELGHIVTDSGDEADRCGCGGVGCAETRASLTGLANLVRRRCGGTDVPPELQGDARRGAMQLRRLAQRSHVHPLVDRIWDEYFAHIGRAARDVANILGPDLIVLSGGAQEREPDGTAEGYARFLARGRKVVRRELRGSFPHLTKIRVEWAVDELADSAWCGAAAYAERLVARGGPEHGAGGQSCAPPPKS